MPSIKLPFHSYQRNVEDGRLVNVFAEANPAGSKSPISLLRSPGIRLHSSPSGGRGRGLQVMGDNLYAVSGGTLYRVTSATSVSLGSVPGTGRVRMSDNGLVLCVVSSPDGYTWDGSTFAQITDPDFTSRGASGVGFIDGYFVFREPNSGRFFQSDLYSTAFDPLKFATAEGATDDLVDFIEDHRQLILLGTRSVEIWWNSGADNFVFDRMVDGFIELGCLGGVAKLDNSVFWVASDRTTRRVSGSTPVRVSTHAVEEAFRGYGSVPYAFTYTLDGHLVYVVQFPDEATWSFDVTTGEWHERQSYGSSTWNICAAVLFNGVTYVQDLDTGDIGILDPDTFTEFSGVQRAEWTYPSVYDGGRELFHNRFELVAHTGVGLSTGQGSDPQLMLEFSDDGGKTWTFAPNRSLGAIGQYKHRVSWHGLGSAVNRVYRCSVSDPVTVKITDTYLDVEKGEV